jgi:hypothetical protein
MTNPKTLTFMAKNAARYLRSATDDEIENGRYNAFDLSFQMEIFTGIPKEVCIEMIMKEKS